MDRRSFLASVGALTLVGCHTNGRAAPPASVADAPATRSKGRSRPDKIELSEDAWRERLTPEQFRVLREKGTERAFTSELEHNHADGVYHCAGCDLPLFDSATKFDSGTGWPSFYAPISEDNVAVVADNSYFMVRTEVLCNRCDGHQGHVFTDGPKPTGLRYCINGVALRFAPRKG